MALGSLTTLFGEDSNVLEQTDFQLLLLANLLGALGMALVSPVVSSLIGPFGVSEARVGLIMAVYSAPSIVVVPITGLIIDKYGRKNALVTGLLIFGAAGSAIALADSFNTVLILRLFQGLGYAGIVPVIITSIGDIYEGGKEATAQGLRFTSSGVSQTIFPLIAGFLVLFGWQYPFYLFVIAVPIGILVFLFFEEPVKDTVTNGETVQPTVSKDKITNIVFDPRTMAVLAGRGFPSAAWIAFLTYNSVLVVQVFNGTAGDAGLLVTAGSLVFAVAASQVGRLLNLTSHWWPLLTMGNGLVIAGVGIMALSPSIEIAILGVIFLGTGVGVTLTLYRSLMTSLTDDINRGSVVGFGETFGRITATSTPIIMGILIVLARPILGSDTALRLTFLLVGLVSGSTSILLSTFIVWRYPREETIIHN